MIKEMEKIINSATEEIMSTLEWAKESFPEAEYHTANYWINDNYNLFADTDKDCIDGTIYVTVKLEQYDNDEECINPEVDSQDTMAFDKTEVYKAIEKLLDRNINVVQ